MIILLNIRKITSTQQQKLNIAYIFSKITNKPRHEFYVTKKWYNMKYYTSFDKYYIEKLVCTVVLIGNLGTLLGTINVIL